MDDAIFDAEFDIAGAFAPAFQRHMRETERKGGGELDVFDGAVIEVEASVVVEDRTAAFTGGEIEERENGKPGAEDECTAGIAEAPSTVAHRVGAPVAKRRPQRLREGDRYPVKRLLAGAGDRVDVDGAERSPPHK